MADLNDRRAENTARRTSPLCGQLQDQSLKGCGLAVANVDTKFEGRHSPTRTSLGNVRLSAMVALIIKSKHLPAAPTWHLVAVSARGRLVYQTNSSLNAAGQGMRGGEQNTSVCCLLYLRFETADMYRIFENHPEKIDHAVSF